MVDFKDVPTFGPERWREATPDERSDAFKQFECDQALKQGRPRCEVIFVDAPARVRGGYDKESTIYINSDVINDDAPHAGIRTIAHEGRHAYQLDVVNRPADHLEVSQNRLNNWTYNVQAYVHPYEDFFAYENQFLEADANRYATEISAELPPEHEYTQLTRNSVNVDAIASSLPSPEHQAIIDSMAAMLPPDPPPQTELSCNLAKDQGLSL